MIIRSTPQNLEDYIAVDDSTSAILHKNGFIPKYMNSSKIYYIKTQTLIEFMEKEGLSCLK